MKKIYIFLLLFFLCIFVYVEAPVFIDRDYPSVLNFGDVMFDRGVRNIIENKGRDPFEYIKKDLDLIKHYDVVMVNLEGPIIEIDRSLCQQKAYNFQFASNTPEILKSVGINMVNLANNHINDCFRVGRDSTKKYLYEAGISYIGDYDLQKSFVVKEINGKKIAFIGMDETVQSIPLKSFYPTVKKLKAENDFVVVNIHWGTEYELGSTKVQRDIAYSLVDNGADVIFGHHPHVIEPVEIYKGKAIFYSLGNFVFDQNFGDTTKGLGVGVEFMNNKNVFKLFPYQIKIFAPDFLKGEEKDSFCNTFLKHISYDNCSFTLEILN